MPKLTPDRDDGRGQLAGNGGPQDGVIGHKDANQQQGDDALEGAEVGAGAQRAPGGSSRDTQP